MVPIQQITVLGTPVSGRALAKLGEKAVARSNCAQNRNILFKCPRWSKETVSIHAPVWGATTFPSSPSPCLNCFNPRPRMGGDLGPPGALVRIPAVSIHAPVWGATRAREREAELEEQFQSTPRYHHQGRRQREVRPNWKSSFNPRPRMGGDQLLIFATGSYQTVSIHAPVWGATPHIPYITATGNVSIHAPVWGAT